MLKLRLDGHEVNLKPGATVLAALATDFRCRWSRDGSARGPLCGMGVCYECGVWIDGQWCLACCTPAHDGMEVRRA